MATSVPRGCGLHRQATCPTGTSASAGMGARRCRPWPTYSLGIGTEPTRGTPCPRAPPDPRWGLDSGSVRFRAALHPLAGPMGFGQFVQVSAAQGEALLATPGVALWRETGGARGTDQLLRPPLRASVGPQPCRERAPLRRARRGAHGTVTGYEGGGGVSRHLRPRLLVDEADEQVLRALGNETIRFRPTWTSWR